jgi:hypothetical protein
MDKATPNGMLRFQSSQNYMTKFYFLPNDQRLGIVALLLLIVSIMMILLNITRTAYFVCMVVLCILMSLISYRIYLMDIKTTLSEFTSTVFNTFITMIILLLYTIFCVFDFSQDELANMPQDWITYSKIFMSILLVQSLFGIYTLYGKNELFVKILYGIGAILNIILFSFFIFLYLITKHFKTDGFLV